MAKKEVDGEGLNIPNRIKALPVKRPGPSPDDAGRQ